MNALCWLFFISLGIVFYTYVGYGLLLVVLVHFKEWFYPPVVLALPDPLPSVTLFMAAYNEEKVIEAKMQNCLELDYPLDKLTLLWVSDGSTDRTNDLLAQYPEATVLYQSQRQGKTAAMNRGMEHVNTPYVIFSDANTLLNREAIKEIVRTFSDTKVGCVAGEKRVQIAEQDNAASGEGFYWKYESTLKHLDSRLCGVTGAAGELFALRTALYEPMPIDTLLDDFILSLRIVYRGYKTAYCHSAYALETSSANIHEEEKRKVRIAAGGLQSISRLLPLLNVFRYGLFSFQYISHRVLRWTLTPVALFLLIPFNIFLALPQEDCELFRLLLGGQVVFYLSALSGKILSEREIKIKALFIPYYFVFMNISVFKGVAYLLRKRKDGIWTRAVRK